MQRDMKKQHGFVIMRAYYGRMSDIRTHLDLMQEVEYWDDQGHRVDEDLGNLMIVNVSIATRFKLDPAAGTLKFNSGESSKQYALGFMNPIPEFIDEKPYLCVVYKQYERDGEGFSRSFSLETKYFRDYEDIII